jgi:hypothetical protein
MDQSAVVEPTRTFALSPTFDLYQIDDGGQSQPSLKSLRIPRFYFCAVEPEDEQVRYSAANLKRTAAT